MHRKIENLIFFLVIACVFICSIFAHDSILSVLGAVFGIIYTVLLGKGKHVAYLFGITGTLCCAVLAYQIGLFGYFALHLFYYFPMEIIGFYNWRRHLNKENNEVIKEKLDNKERLLLAAISCFLSVVLYFIFIKFKDINPVFDAVTTALSILGMFLSVKRYVEQWAVWILVDILLIFMWFFIVKSGENTLAILISRVIYLFLGIYFYKKWKKSYNSDIL